MIMLYEKIRDYLLEKIEGGKPGEKLPSENELCKQFGVSRITVQRAIKDLLEEKIIFRRKGKGTFVAPSLSSRFIAPKTIKIIYPAGGDPEDDFLFPIIRGLIDQFQHQHFDFVLSAWKSNKIRRIDASETSGIFWIAPAEKNFQMIEEISMKGIPIIVINRVMKNFVNFVSTDHYKAGVMGTEYLVSSGHQRIGFVGFIKDNTCSSQMYEGYCSVLEKYGLKEFLTLVVPAHFKKKLEPTKDFCKKLSQLVERHCPTGLFVAGELFLDSVLRILEEKNLTPGKDIDVVITDEIPEGTKHKENITSIIQPLREIGDIAARAMKQIMRGETRRIRISLAPVIKPAKQSMQIFEKTERR